MFGSLSVLNTSGMYNIFIIRKFIVTNPIIKLGIFVSFMALLIHAFLQQSRVVKSMVSN